MKRRFYTLDVFTSRQFAGNPLAVVTDGDGISTERMQAIAREMNLSETVFVQRPSHNRALARLRIFTTTQELPLAGHPVIGTWFLLATLGVVPLNEGTVRITQEVGAGLLPVDVEFENGRPSRVTMVQKPARFFPARVPAKALMEALGLRAGDLHPKLPLEYASTGIFNLMVPLRSRTALKRIRLDIHALAHLIAEHGTLAYCFAAGRRGEVFARGMVPWALYEDPATGSAAGSLAAYLVQHGKLALGENLQIHQGIEMGRPSEISVQVEQAGSKLVPRVSGTAVLVMEGHIEV
ncbi:MAG TPA: PhzF family phenazine biosynthesis protein [Candidatus Acidoferrales bacterium]|nr:PhzF family phenazine biosynthesis protein [Candidatus Acidoferrales bacterium]